MPPFPRRFQPPLGPPRLNPRDRVLAQWRGVHLAPMEKAARLQGRGLADLLPGVVQRLGLDRRRQEAEIGRAWNDLLDPALAAHAQPCNLARGTLFVNVDSHAWLDEIVRYRRREILERLQNAFGREFIQKISFRVG